MRAKRLEAILSAECKIPEAEMLQRFQSLRNMRLLPTSRGRNAEDITREAIVSGLFSIVSERPGMAGTIAMALRGLKPVGGPENAFAQANGFAQALQVALDNNALLDSIVEIRMTDSEVAKNSFARGAIAYKAADGERVVYYVQKTALSLLQPGAESTYNPRSTMADIIRETIVFPRILGKIMREVRESERRVDLMTRPIP